MSQGLFFLNYDQLVCPRVSIHVFYFHLLLYVVNLSPNSQTILGQS